MLGSPTSAWPEPTVFSVPPNTPLREDEHRARAERHQVVGDALAAAGDEWAAVMWFYSAYHLIKAALLCDPIWFDLRSLTTLNVELTPGERFTGRHKGRRRIGSNQPREWGINDLVLVLYRPAAGFYERLHQASIDVRYGAGLPAGALPDLDVALKRLFEMDSKSKLRAPLLPPHGGATEA